VKDNGGFPLILSAKISDKLGEIMVSHAGKNIFDLYNIQNSLDNRDNHKGFDLKTISVFGMQIVS
jgi:hypothetical protein